MDASVLHHEYICVYISAKKGSVFNMIPELDRKISIRVELRNYMFSLRYRSNPKKNFFLGHPVFHFKSKNLCSFIHIHSLFSTKYKNYWFMLGV